VDKNSIFDGSPIIDLARNKRGERLFKFNRQRVDRFIKLYGERAGIDPRKLHIHALKHSSGMIFWEASGGNIGLLQRHLGHKAASSSLVYLYEADASKASAIMNGVRI
jgi:integrase